MIFLGYFIAILIGVISCVLGGGGAILTIPTLVYIFKIPPVLATSYSLFIVGLTSIFGVSFYNKEKLVEFKTGFFFSIPSILGLLLSRKILLPSIPEKILATSFFNLTKDSLVITFFGIIMLLASFSMIKKEKVQSYVKNSSISEIMLKGFGVGGVTGFVGAGGGFMIIPVLALSLKLEMKKAVATSLFIIAINSSFGFLGDIISNKNIDWNFLLYFCSFTVFGVIIGNYIAKFISSEKLKPAFGYFVLIMGIFVILKEFLK
ncbi:MAG: sulfite exporter TauE/SafE family protein [Candidatus Sericytochromatia bacterium]